MSDLIDEARRICQERDRMKIDCLEMLIEQYDYCGEEAIDVLISEGSIPEVERPRFEGYAVALANSI